MRKPNLILFSCFDINHQIVSTYLAFLNISFNLKLFQNSSKHKYIQNQYWREEKNKFELWRQLISDQNDVFILQRKCITKRWFYDTLFTISSLAFHPENPWRLFAKSYILWNWSPLPKFHICSLTVILSFPRKTLSNSHLKSSKIWKFKICVPCVLILFKCFISNRPFKFSSFMKVSVISKCWRKTHRKYFQLL